MSRKAPYSEHLVARHPRVAAVGGCLLLIAVVLALPFVIVRVLDLIAVLVERFSIIWLVVAVIAIAGVALTIVGSWPVDVGRDEPRGTKPPPPPAPPRPR